MARFMHAYLQGLLNVKSSFDPFFKAEWIKTFVLFTVNEFLS